MSLLVLKRRGSVDPRLAVTGAVALVAVGAVISAVVLRVPHEPDATGVGSDATGRRVVVVEGDHTLESLSKLLADPTALRYDPRTRTAVSDVTLRIRGRLRLGAPDGDGSGETLEMNTHACGDLRVEVESGGELVMHRSTLTTVGKVLAGGQCPQGYGLKVAGKLVAIGSHLNYMSGTVSESLLAGASAEIRDSSIVRGDSHCLLINNPDGRRLTIEGSGFGVETGVGLVLTGQAEGGPLVIRDSPFRSGMHVAAVNARDGKLDLIDCDLDDAPKFSFAANVGSAEVRIRWTVNVRVVRRGTDGKLQPVVGAQVSASASGRPDNGPGLEAVTDARGVARLTLTQSTALPGSSTPAAAGPHRLRATADGKSAEREIDVHGKGYEFEIELP